ncbi:MAG: valine--tRNA ligase [Thermodesulfobacteriota bacterium]|nr:valine--tRNA ligase [Thermodesulfobacteriota bacterium]
MTEELSTMDKILPKAYEPHEVEKRWYSFWEQEGLFVAKITDEKRPYSIVIPPPNITGSLHMGHALNNILQDILIRYKRMAGYNTLWVPGTDHAGIATQNVVERQLAAEGLDRHTVGREKFIERVWRWKEESGGQIINQLKRLGCACDWSRQRFTMDDGLSRAVREVFVRLYREGLIYRGDYIINWCPRCHTALADLEVEHENHKGSLYHIRYPYADGTGYVVVATTRPETMLGDTAVAVSPEDERYKNVIGRNLILPLLKRAIPVISDSYVDPSFGTGALKVTPAHDPNDFEIGLRHKLPAVKVMDETGHMNDEAGPYRGLDRYECRKKVVADIEAEGLLEKVEPLEHAVGHCYRCKTVVEPTLSKQWFVSVKPLAEKAIAAVETGQTRIIPKMWENTYFDWMHNIRDWCISRQIWWGHRIPAWYCDTCGEIIIDTEAPVICPKCAGTHLRQEEDVLDTWFSSALWPFSTLGWPDETRELKLFYPTTVLITGFDILFFWVARMLMMGLHFMGNVPFADAYIHALVRDAEGQKMSKSKGNVIDPLIIMDKYGTDAFRFTLAAFAAQGRDIRLSEQRIEGYRHFINKVWNASRFALMNAGECLKTEVPQQPSMLTLENRWILSRLKRVIDTVREGLDDYRFNDSAQALYQFFWHEFCDWYLEMVKPALYLSEDQDVRSTTRQVMLSVLSASLRLLHPSIPFVTEELWHYLPGSTRSIMEASFPESKDYPEDLESEGQMGLLMDVITGIRNLRSEMNVHPAQKVNIIVLSGSGPVRELIFRHGIFLKNLAKVEGLEIRADGGRPKGAVSCITDQVETYMLLEGVVDISAETAKLQKEAGKLQTELKRVQNKLANSDFLERAPAEIIDKEKGKVQEFVARLEKIDANLKRLEEIRA